MPDDLCIPDTNLEKQASFGLGRGILQDPRYIASALPSIKRPDRSHELVSGDSIRTVNTVGIVSLSQPTAEKPHTCAEVVGGRATGTMRAAVLLLTWAASASASAWTDKEQVIAINSATSKVSFHGPGLIYRGEVWNGDKTKTAEAAQTYIAKSVMTGKDSFYPKSLPETLKTPYVVPDSTHPKLAFWYEPFLFVSARAAARCLTRPSALLLPQVHPGRV